MKHQRTGIANFRALVVLVSAWSGACLAQSDPAGEASPDRIATTLAPIGATDAEGSAPSAASVPTFDTPALDERFTGTSNASTGVNCATPQGPLLPAGWTVTYAANVTTCSPPFTSGFYSICLPGRACFNQYTYTSFYDVPVGGSMRYCSAIGVPAGWQVTQLNLPASCPGSGADSIMQHVSCISGQDTNCYPQSASITASPRTVLIPFGQGTGSTTVNWNTVNYSNPCVWISNNGGAAQLWGCSGGGAHSAVWPYVPEAGTTTLWISDGGSASPSPNIAQVVVTGQQGAPPPSTMTASQNPVIVPAGQTTGTFTLSWNAPGHSQVDLWGEQNLQSPGQKLFLGSGPSSGTALEPMSVGEIATLWLYAHGDTTTPLAILHLTGQH
jgi:hypothetical protein